MHNGHMNAHASSSSSSAPMHYRRGELATPTADTNGEGFSGLFVAAMGALGLLTGGAGVSAWNHTVAMSELEANATNKRQTLAAEQAMTPLAAGSNVDQAQIASNTAHIQALNAQVAQLTKALGRYALWSPSEDGVSALPLSQASNV